MTLILEFEHKLIFYKPGILRYAMRRAVMQLGASQSGTERRELLSYSLKCGWAEARAELAALQRLRTLAPGGFSDAPSHSRMDLGAGGSPNKAPPTALARQQLH